MKPYTSRAEVKKSMSIQVFILTAAIILLSLTGRLLTNKKFSMSVILAYENKYPMKTEDITIRWKKESIPVSDYSVKKVTEQSILIDMLDITMLPEKAGSYRMEVLDRGGNVLLKDTIYVDRFGTAFSKMTGSFTGDEFVIMSGILFYLGLSLIMLLIFRRLKGPMAYSYEAILSCGVFLFSLFVLVIELPSCISHMRSPGLYPTWQLLDDVASGGSYFTIFTSPLLIIFSILLIISNIELLRHERPRFQNILGLLLGLITIVGEIIFYRMFSVLNQSLLPSLLLRRAIENVAGVIFAYLECILISSIINGLRAARHVPATDRDYILILGCGFRQDGTLPPLLQGRVDKAMEFWHRQKEETGKEAVIIPSGGQGKNEPMAEARAMYNYMINSGFPEEAIIQENQSANTYQNMAFSKKVIENREPAGSDPKVAFATTNYHVFRSGVWAGLADLKAEGIGSKTRWWFWPNAFIRECVGLLKNRLIPESVGLACLIAFFSVLTMLAYL